MRAWMIAGAAWAALSIVWAAEGSGKDLFEKRCGGCHALDRDKEGPRLGGIYGRRAGSGGDYPYSSALRESGIVWTDDTLDRWLTDPEAMVPGSDMGFRLEKAEERRLVIRFLREKGKE